MDIWEDGPRSCDSWIYMCVARIRLSFKIKLRIGLKLLLVNIRLDDDDVVEDNACQTEMLMCVCHSIE